MARHIGIDTMSLYLIIKNKLIFFPYKFQMTQYLNEKMQGARLKKCQALLRRFGRGSHQRILFADENLFTIEAQFNKQNERI